MTNYERIQQDKAFCAWLLSEESVGGTHEQWMEWLDAEQRELTDDREHKEDA